MAEFEYINAAGVARLFGINNGQAVDYVNKGVMLSHTVEGARGLQYAVPTWYAYEAVQNVPEAGQGKMLHLAKFAVASATRVQEFVQSYDGAIQEATQMKNGMSYLEIEDASRLSGMAVGTLRHFSECRRGLRRAVVRPEALAERTFWQHTALDGTLEQTQELIEKKEPGAQLDYKDKPEVARQLGINLDTLKFWSETGLLLALRRAGSDIPTLRFVPEYLDALAQHLDGKPNRRQALEFAKESQGLVRQLREERVQRLLQAVRASTKGERYLQPRTAAALLGLSKQSCINHFGGMVAGVPHKVILVDGLNKTLGWRHLTLSQQEQKLGL